MTLEDEGKVRGKMKLHGYSYGSLEEVLEYKGLPLDTPYKDKTYSDRIAGSRFSYLESCCDRLYRDLRVKKGNLEASSSSTAQIIYPLPLKPKPMPPFRVLEESKSKDEDYIDSVYEKVYGKKGGNWMRKL
nr:hypothetical protein [Tanacetum cinerariifolium]